MQELVRTSLYGDAGRRKLYEAVLMVSRGGIWVSFTHGLELEGNAAHVTAHWLFVVTLRRRFRIAHIELFGALCKGF